MGIKCMQHILIHTVFKSFLPLFYGAIGARSEKQKREVDVYKPYKLLRQYKNQYKKKTQKKTYCCRESLTDDNGLNEKRKYIQ